jgi:surface antigen
LAAVRTFNEWDALPVEGAVKLPTISAVAAVLIATTAHAQRWDNDRWGDNGRHDEYRNEHPWRQGDRRPRIDPRDHRRDGPEDREDVWRRHYSHAYVYEDDPAYTECRKETDPLGVIAGAVIGGVLGNAASHGQGAVTVGGVIAGGAIGAALTQKMNCDDRRYAYETYSKGFNAGRKNASYSWKNPQDGHGGRFYVDDYYTDESGFRCSYYRHDVFIDGRREQARGRACQQPNGSWAIID